MGQSAELEANTCNQRQERENACEQVTISFGFNSHWLTNFRVSFQPTTERKSKPIATHNYFRELIENRFNTA